MLDKFWVKKKYNLLSGKELLIQIKWEPKDPVESVLMLK